MIHAITDCETNYSYNYNSVTFEQHNHVHYVDTNGHSVCNLCAVSTAMYIVSDICLDS